MSQRLYQIKYSSFKIHLNPSSVIIRNKMEAKWIIEISNLQYLNIINITMSLLKNFKFKYFLQIFEYVFLKIDFLNFCNNYDNEESWALNHLFRSCSTSRKVCVQLIKQRPTAAWSLCLEILTRSSWYGPEALNFLHELARYPSTAMAIRSAKFSLPITFPNAN